MMKPNSLQNLNIEERSVNEIAKKPYENSAEVKILNHSNSNLSDMSRYLENSL